MNFFERMIVKAVSEVLEKNDVDLKALKIRMEVPTILFPRITSDEAIKRTGKKAFEQSIAGEMRSQFFWVTGLMRENYDLIYPYLNENGSISTDDE